MNNCGKTWTEEECLEEFPEAAALLYQYRCETQKLSKGPYLPPASCNIDGGDTRYVDYCSRVAKEAEAPPSPGYYARALNFIGLSSAAPRRAETTSLFAVSLALGLASLALTQQL